jgi:hypothetical protein
MRTNHPGSAALNFTASNLTPLRFFSAIDHLCGKRVCVAKTKVAGRIEAACFPTSVTFRYSRGRRFAFKSRRGRTVPFLVFGAGLRLPHFVAEDRVFTKGPPRR